MPDERHPVPLTDDLPLTDGLLDDLSDIHPRLERPEGEIVDRGAAAQDGDIEETEAADRRFGAAAVRRPAAG